MRGHSQRNSQGRCGNGNNGNSGGYSYGNACGAASTTALHNARARFLVIRYR